MTWTESQFEALFRALYPRLLRASQLLLGDRAAAEDVAQEAFARLLAREALPAPDAERWVFRVGRNLAVSRLRQVRRLLPLTEAEAMEGWEAGDRAERRALLLSAAVKELPPKQREVVALRIYAELPYEAIARTVGRSLGAVKQELHRARLALRSKLNGSDVEDGDAW
jgi:RNA polymerase sigma factor (sigma-70 family)